MKKGDVINGYTIVNDFSIAGGGQSKWAFGKKDAQEFFIKQFLTPKYPIEGSPGSEAIKAQKKLACESFETHHRNLMTAVNSCCSEGGNLVYTKDFFRNGATYYKVTEKVPNSTWTVHQIKVLDPIYKGFILKVIAHALAILHKKEIVHGDLKPANILLSFTSMKLVTVKLIDFDNSFFSSKPPNPDDMVGDPTYYSPEMEQYILQKPEIKANDLTLASDIFALAVVFCEYVTGEPPKFDKKKYKYPSTAVLNGEVLKAGLHDMPARLNELVTQMLLLDPLARPNIGILLDYLKATFYTLGKDLKGGPLKSTLDTSTKEIETTDEKVGLKGTGLKTTIKTITEPSETPIHSPIDEPVKTAPPVSTDGKLKGSLFKKKE